MKTFGENGFYSILFCKNIFEPIFAKTLQKRRITSFDKKQMKNVFSLPKTNKLKTRKNFLSRLKVPRIV